MNLNKQQVEEYISSLIAGKTGRGDIKQVTAWQGNFKALATQLKPKQHLFFGQLRINYRLFCLKSLGLLDGTDFATQFDLYSKFYGEYQELLASNYDASGTLVGQTKWPLAEEQPLEFHNILFDDLVFKGRAALTSLNDADLDIDTVPSTSIQNLVKQNNANIVPPFSAVYSGATGRTAYPQFTYIPPFISFIGYIINAGT